ncbi:MAG: tetratricopeptide repeat protein [Pirellulaceae bacterium]|nr:tetratricopeptide repeat protein [Pirellulaceae bacterium]
MATLEEGLKLAIASHQAGQLAHAEQMYRQILAIAPNHSPALYRLALLGYDSGNHQAAIELFRRAIELEPQNSEYYLDYGLALDRDGQIDKAIEAYEQALILHPIFVEALNILGTALRRTRQLDRAIPCFEKAIALRPAFAEAYNNLGVALQDDGQFEKAASSFRQSLAIRTDLADVHFNLGNVLRQLGKHSEAVASLDIAIQFRPDFSAAYNCRGRVFHDMGAFENAVADHRQSISLFPNEPESHYDLGLAFEAMGNPKAAADAYRHAYQLRPDYVEALDALVHQIQHLCRWEELESLSQKLLTIVMARTGPDTIPPKVAPFSFLSLHIPTSHAQQLQCAQSWCQRFKEPAASADPLTPPAHQPLALAAVSSPKNPTSNQHSRKIKIGYLSSDFREHPVALLICELIESHDRDRFEIFGYGLRPNDSSSIGTRIRSAFDQYRTLTGVTTELAAQQIADDNLDVLVDLNGLTQFARPDILARRPAPIQVNYLGYPGTTGSNFIDYILVDDFVVPADQQPYFTERLVSLPGCFMVNDSRREIASITPTRSELGLPDSALVLCVFSAPYKISMPMFDVWMQLLRSIPDSVLWLRDTNPWATENLRRNATLQSVASERLVFAPKVTMPEHLARHRAADLFLDTFPYNQHSTASDALRMGLPVITLAGETFASRVAGSLLRTLELDELITYRREDYLQLVQALASDRHRLSNLRQRLVAKMCQSELFDGKAFARKIESAFLSLVGGIR